MNKKKLAKARNSSLLDTDEDKENDTLNLIHWKQVHRSHVEQIEQLLENLKVETQKNTTQEEYWTTEIDRCNGEGQLYLGKKSKLTQFGDMCEDPQNAKYNVQKEQDLQVENIFDFFISGSRLFGTVWSSPLLKILSNEPIGLL